MDLTRGLQSLLAVFAVAAPPPGPVAALPGPKIPQVVFFLVGGVIIGPHVLGVANTDSVQSVANAGLGFLFLLAGDELDPTLLRRKAGRLAMTGWVVSVLISVGVTAALATSGFVKDYVPISLALTTTALGTLLPILHDNGMLGGNFGRYVFAAGAVGELFPIIAIAVFLSQGSDFAALVSLVSVVLLALALAAVPFLVRSERLQTILRDGQNATSQVMLRWSVVLLFGLLVVAAHFGQDVVLGAVLAGIVLRGWTQRMGIDVRGLEDKFDAVGYGIFIPARGVVGDDARHCLHRPEPAAAVAVPSPAAGGPGAAGAADLPEGAAAAQAGGDDLHHCHRDAAAGGAGRDRPAGRQDHPGPTPLRWSARVCCRSWSSRRSPSRWPRRTPTSLPPSRPR